MRQMLRGFVRQRETIEGSAERDMEYPAELTDLPHGGQEVAIRAGDAKVVLNDYLPRGMAFSAIAGAKYETFLGVQSHSPKNISEMPRVVFPPERLKNLLGRLLLFHEMGHAEYERSPEYKHKRYHSAVITRADSIIDPILKSKQYADLPTPEAKYAYFVSEFKKAWDKAAAEPSNVPMRYGDLINALNDLVANERMAWASGLALYQRIKRETGVDVFEGASTADVLAAVRKPLEGYQRTYGPLFGLGGDDARLSPRGWVDTMLDTLARRL